MPYVIRPMEPADVSTVADIDRLSFPTPWPAAAFRHELRQPQSHYFVLVKPAADETAQAGRGCSPWMRRIRSLLRISGLPLLQPSSPVIGYTGFRVEGDEAHITTIALHPDWRGRGLGELLLLTTMEEAIKWHANLVTLEMRTSNRVAHSLYRKYGFRVKERQQEYYRDGEDAWLMEAKVDRLAYQVRLAELRQALGTRLRQQRIEVGQNKWDAL